MSQDRLVIRGGRALSGHIVPSGNKNAALPILAACLLTDEEVVVENVPDILDVHVMLALLDDLGVSIRDDGPLPETMMDLEAAQERYAEALDGVKMVLILSTMLHGIGVGNMLPSWVRVVCVDINPAVVTKLSDRGSAQTVGVVTDVGLFLHRLAERLRS